MNEANMKLKAMQTRSASDNSPRYASPQRT